VHSLSQPGSSGRNQEIEDEISCVFMYFCLDFFVDYHGLYSKEDFVAQLKGLPNTSSTNINKWEPFVNILQRFESYAQRYVQSVEDFDKLHTHPVR
jgi:hypothetical protein